MPAQFVVCVPVTDGSATTSVAPCVDAGGEHYSPVMMQLPTSGEPDFSNSDQLFAYGLTAVLTFWALGIAVGAILSLLRREH
jgi:hypothetical protein